MTTTLYEDIIKKLKALNEQADLPPLPPAGSSGAGGDSAGTSSSDDEEMVGSGQPTVDKEDPIRAIYDYGNAIAKETVDVETITNAFKSAIQANFGYKVEDAWPIVERLRNTENQTLINVANRLALYISGSIQESNKRNYMKITREEIRSFVRESLKTRKASKIKEVNISPIQLEKIVYKTVQNLVNEGALFDTYRSQIDHEQSQIEQQLTSADIRRMAIDLFEKICDKTGVDADSLTPEAMQFVKAELDRMVTSAQEIANKLVQVAAVVKTASSERSTTKSEEGQG